MREHVHVIRHQHARDEVERLPKPRPQIGASDAVLEGTGAGSGTRDEVKELGLRHASIMRGCACARTRTGSLSRA
ncbi:MAG: hypothetical protein M5U30_10595 [Burkholderiaceae bacterium]|nr:hypothetical protein [Burkholderiaceae bacterium]